MSFNLRGKSSGSLNVVSECDGDEKRSEEDGYFMQKYRDFHIVSTE